MNLNLTEAWRYSLKANLMGCVVENMGKHKAWVMLSDMEKVDSLQPADLLSQISAKVKFQI